MDKEIENCITDKFNGIEKNGRYFYIKNHKGEN